MDEESDEEGEREGRRKDATRFQVVRSFLL